MANPGISEKKNSKRIIETRVTRISFENGIIYSHLKEGAEITLDDQKESSKAVNTLVSGNSSFAVLVDTRRIKSISAEARKFTKEHLLKNATRCAMLISSPVSKIIGNVFIGINRPLIPTKLFTSEEAAVTWLKQTESK